MRIKCPLCTICKKTACTLNQTIYHSAIKPGPVCMQAVFLWKKQEVKCNCKPREAAEKLQILRQPAVVTGSGVQKKKKKKVIPHVTWHTTQIPEKFGPFIKFE